MGLNLNIMISSMDYQDSNRFSTQHKRVNIDGYKLTQKERKILGVDYKTLKKKGLRFKDI